jgi:2-methylcitrate dehydratase PrpD
MSTTPEVSRSLAEFVVRTRWEDIPQAMRHEAKRSLVNFFACALAGCRDPALIAAGKVFARFSSGEDCTIIGRHERTDMLHAAALNAMAANVFDYDDTHLPTIIHPTAPVAPALFALAETCPMSGQDLLLAFILGVEVECRLGNAISPWHYQRGWHITSTCGVFGAAAAVAKVMGLDATRTLWALGNASAQASGLVETLGTASKSMGVGNAASNGLLSAMLAAEGFEGPPQPLEGARGFLRVMGDKPDFESIVTGLGETWEIQKNTYKPYPCGVVLNPVIEACLELHKEPGLDVNAIERIEITGHPLLRERTDRPAPKNGREAQVSARHAVAVSLVRGKAGLDEFSDACVAEAGLRAIGDKLAFINDAGYSVESASIALHMRGGKTLSHHIKAARGGLGNPLRDEDLTQKLETLAAWGGSGCTPLPLTQTLWSLETRAEAGTVIRLS